MNFVTIDFETANSKRDSVCSVGLAIVQDNCIIDTKYFLINPKDEFDAFNIYIHGITPEDVINEPEFPDIWDEIKPLLENNLVFAHNASFDMSVLRNVLNKYKLEYPSINYSCSRVISKNTWSMLRNYKLTTVANHLNITFNHHNAKEDAIACAKIIISALEHNNVFSIGDLNSKLGLVLGSINKEGYIAAGVTPNNHKLSAKDIVAITSDFDESHPLFNKNIVFTGKLESMPRKDAMQKAVNVGAICSDTVNKLINFLVIGIQDETKLNGKSKSSKMLKAEKLINDGYDLEIITEDEFLKLI